MLKLEEIAESRNEDSFDEIEQTKLKNLLPEFYKTFYNENVISIFSSKSKKLSF